MTQSTARPMTIPKVANQAAAFAAWIVILGPVITLLLKVSPSHIVSAYSVPDAFGPALTSLVSALLAVAAIVIGGSALAWYIATNESRLVRILEGGLLAMLVMPPLVIGLLLVFMIGPLTPIGEMLSRVHLSGTNTFFALVVAEIYEALPYFVLGAASAFKSVDREMLLQARLLGDSFVRMLFRVVVPQAAPQLASAISMAWARAVGAFGAVIIIAYHPYGLPMQVWVSLNEVGLAQALPYALALVVVAVPLPLIAYAFSRHAVR